MSFSRTQKFNAGTADPAIERVFLRTVFGWMFVGLAVTAGIAGWFSSNEQVMAKLEANSTWMIVAIVVQLGLVMGISFGINKISSATATMLFMLYAGITGVVFAVILSQFSTGSIAMAFAGAAGVFGGMAAWGYTTKRDLSGLGPVLFGALIGLIVASVVFAFVGGQMFNLILGYAGVVIFAGLTAWDIQQIKSFSAAATDEESGRKLAIFGALSLYLNFINIFLSLLRIFGSSR